MDHVWTRDRLAAAMAEGKRFQFLPFWGHTPKDPKQIDASCLSQWFPRTFEQGGVQYRSAEHFMMAAKARLFEDSAALEKILVAATPNEAKKLGREVERFSEERWKAARTTEVVAGNVAKFGQHADLRDFLLSTGDRVLVEASPRDRIWGIGMGAANPDAQQPAAWRGLNLLGFALMEARRLLSA